MIMSLIHRKDNDYGLLLSFKLDVRRRKKSVVRLPSAALAKWLLEFLGIPSNSQP